MATLGAATVARAMRDSLRNATDPSQVRVTSELVPPMSNPTARAMAWRRATPATAHAPPAGPENSVSRAANVAALCSTPALVKMNARDSGA